MNIFSLDSPFMRFTGKMADIMIVNVLTIICSIPIITAGAAYTAMHYVLLKIYKDETTHITKDFFHGFLRNFKDATILWSIYLFWGVFLGLDYFFIYSKGLGLSTVFQIAIYAITVLLIFSLTWVFILLSRYENSRMQTMINSLTVGIANFGKTITMAILMVAPYCLFLMFPMAVPIVLLIGVALFGYLQTVLYCKTFETLEHSEE